jgi:glycosyltransferase involved in cell wall biosynthesis
MREIDRMNARSPLVSVILPVYNRGHLLQRVVTSVLSQSHDNLELIIVDDASSDDTEERVAALADPRLRYIRHSHNQGASVARNTGIEVARGEYIAFMDDDDEWVGHKLAAQLAVFVHSELPELGIVTCGHYMMSSGERGTLWIPTQRGWVFETLLLQKRIGCRPPSLLIRSSVLRDHRIRFDPNLPARQDWDFVAQVSRKCQLDFVPEPLVLVHQHPGERVWTPDRAIRAGKYLHEKYREEFLQRPEAHNKFHLRLALSCMAAGDWVAARHQVLAGIRARPRALSSYLWLLLSYSGRRGQPTLPHRALIKPLRALTF